MISKSCKIEYLSFWNDIPLQHVAEEKNMFCTAPLRVVSWNILGDGSKLALSAKHDYCPRHLRLWAKDSAVPSSFDTGATEAIISSRCERTAETLLSLAADIYCLQECLPKMFDDLLAYGPLQNEFIGFHMKDHMVHSIHDFLSDDKTTVSNDNKNHPSAYEPTGTTADVANVPNKCPATLGQEEYGNALLLRRSLILDGTIQINWVKSGLFQTIGPQLASTASSRVTGRARKRFLTLDCYGFVAMKLRIRLSRNMGLQQQTTSNGNISGMEEPIDAIIIGTHLYWNPWDPHVKALQAEVLAQVCNICAQGALPRYNATSSISDKKVTAYSEEEASKSTAPRTSDIGVNNINTRDKQCVIIVGGDFNSVPHFQPEFVETKEECQTLMEMCYKQGSMSSDTSSVQRSPPAEDSSVAEVKIQIKRLPISFRQSGVFRLLTHGLLEPNHPEHPDTYGRGGAMVLKKSKKIKVCGPMYANPFEITSPNGFQMAYDYPHETLTINDEEMHTFECWHTKNEDSRNAWPALTTKVPEFEGVIDYIFWKFCSRKHSLAESNREQSKFYFQQTESLRVPYLRGPIPDESFTSDHLPVGMGFCIRAHND